MNKTLTVNRAQVLAARLIVKRAERGVGCPTPAVLAIAAAKRRRPKPTEGVEQS